MLEEYPLLSFRPIDVLLKTVNLNLLVIWEHVKAVEKCLNCAQRLLEDVQGRGRWDVLGLAVFVFPMDSETSERWKIITSDMPFALLGIKLSAAFDGTHFRSRFNRLILTRALTLRFASDSSIPGPDFTNWRCWYHALSPQALICPHLVVIHQYPPRVSG